MVSDRNAAVSLGIWVMLMSSVPPAEAIVLPTNFQEVVVVAGSTQGLSWPVGMAFLPDGRLVVIQQSGQVRLVVNGALVSTVLLNMPEVVFSGERGLLGIAVDPNFPTRPYIYLFYSADGTMVPCPNMATNCSHLARYTVGGDVSVPTSTNLTIDPASKVLLINQIPDNAPNHNGGTLRFGLDKTLYVSMGDDADNCAAQDLTQLKGKILRIKVDDTITPLDLTTMVAPGNPFGGSTDTNTRLVWAYGLRNPFRFSVDPISGTLAIGDVGENSEEEADRASLEGGDNFGWPYIEGTLPFRDCNGAAPDPTGFVPPIIEYPHVSGGGAYAVIGGPVYAAPPGAGSAAFPPNYQGVFFVSDYYHRFLYALRFNCGTGQWDKIPGATTDFWATDLAEGVSDITVGPDGGLYYISQAPSSGGAGSVRKIVYTGAQPGAGKTFTVTPCRVLDTRNPGGGGRLAANSCRAVRVAGSGLGQGGADTCGIPSTATAVYMNIVAVTPAAGYLTVFPAGWTPPLASTLNFANGQTIANGILMAVCHTVPASTCTADIVVQTGPGTADVVIDVTGYTAAP
ncbi:MAG TPA: PQQ-dependent sugar dehydrogenase [Candidatus Methylomirabilis sp.]|nr:PQQ-dependent sugar dehydrogenase [Candidatus Methylomirabilis sp.]